MRRWEYTGRRKYGEMENSYIGGIVWVGIQVEHACEGK